MPEYNGYDGLFVWKLYLNDKGLKLSYSVYYKMKYFKFLSDVQSKYEPSLLRPRPVKLYMSRAWA